MPQDDILNILNSSQNTENQQGTSDDELNIINGLNEKKQTQQSDALGVLNSNRQSVTEQNIQPERFVKSNNNFNIDYTDDEKAAREEGATQARAGIIRSSVGSSSDLPSIEEPDVKYGGTLDEASALYASVLGITQYEDLRTLVGLKDNESFTDYYRRTKYIPKGYEKTARLLMAEEKQKKLWSEYESGNMGYADFLYEAYGKDYLKSQGYDFGSSLFWYQRYQNGQYDDPMTDTLLADAISYADESFRAAKWFQESSSSNIEKLCATYVTGKKLTVDQVKDILPGVFEALDDYYSSDEKILRMYKGGYLDINNFNPLIDVDNDGMADYYLHLDGKLYAVEGSSGKGNRTAKVYYNTDNSLDRVVISKGLYGNNEVAEHFSSFSSSLLNTLGSIVDLGALLVAGTGWAVTGANNNTFQDLYGGYNAAKNSTLLFSSNTVSFEGFKWNEGDDWNRGIANAAGVIVGLIISSKIAGAIAGIAKTAGESARLADAGSKAYKFYTAVQKTAEVTGRAYGIMQGMRGGMIMNATESMGNWAASHAIQSTLIQASILATQDALRTGANLMMKKEVYEMNGIELSSGEIVGRMAMTFALNTLASFAFRNTADNIGSMERLQLLAGKINGLAHKVQGVALNDYNTIEHILGNEGLMQFSRFVESGWGTFTDSTLDIVENILTQTNSAYFSDASNNLGDAGAYFSTMKGIVCNPEFIINNLYIFGKDMGVTWRGFDGKIQLPFEIDQKNRKIELLIQNYKNIEEWYSTAKNALEIKRQQFVAENTEESLAKAESISKLLEVIDGYVLKGIDENGEPLKGTKVSNILKAAQMMQDVFEHADPEFFNPKLSENDVNAKRAEVSKFFKDSNLSDAEVQTIYKVLTESSDNFVRKLCKASVMKAGVKIYIDRVEALKTYYSTYVSGIGKETKDLFTGKYEFDEQYIKNIKKILSGSTEDAKKQFDKSNQSFAKSRLRNSLKIISALNTMAHSAGLRICIDYNTTNSRDFIDALISSHIRHSVDSSEFTKTFEDNFEAETVLAKLPGQSQSEEYIKIFGDDNDPTKRSKEQEANRQKAADELGGLDGSTLFYWKKTTDNQGNKSCQNISKILDFLSEIGYLTKFAYGDNNGNSAYAFTGKTGFYQHTRMTADIGNMCRAIYLLIERRTDVKATAALDTMLKIMIENGDIDGEIVPDEIKDNFEYETKTYSQLNPEEKEKYHPELNKDFPKTNDKQQQDNYEVKIVRIKSGIDDFTAVTNKDSVKKLQELRAFILTRVALSTDGTKNLLTPREYYEALKDLGFSLEDVKNGFTKTIVSSQLSVNEQAVDNLLKYCVIEEKVGQYKHALISEIEKNKMVDPDKIEISSENRKIFYDLGNLLTKANPTEAEKFAIEQLKIELGDKVFQEIYKRSGDIVHSFIESQLNKGLAESLRNKITSFKEQLKGLVSTNEVTDADLLELVNTLIDEIDLNLVKQNKFNKVSITLESIHNNETTPYIVINELFNKLGVTYGIDTYEGFKTCKDMMISFAESYDSYNDKSKYNIDGMRQCETLDDVYAETEKLFTEILHNELGPGGIGKSELYTYFDPTMRFINDTSDFKATLRDSLLMSAQAVRDAYKNAVVINGNSDKIVVNLNILSTKIISDTASKFETAYQLSQMKESKDIEAVLSAYAKKLDSFKSKTQLENLIKLYGESVSGILTFDKTIEGESQFMEMMISLGYSEGEVNSIFSSNRSNIAGVYYNPYDSLGFVLEDVEGFEEKLFNLSHVQRDIKQNQTNTVVDMNMAIQDRFNLFVNEETIDNMVAEIKNLKKADLKKIAETFGINISFEEGKPISTAEGYKIIKDMFFKLGKSAGDNGNRFVMNISNIQRFNIPTELTNMFIVSELCRVMSEVSMNNTPLMITGTKEMFDGMNGKYKDFYDISFDSTTKTIVIKPKQNDGVWSFNNVFNFIKKQGSDFKLRDLIIFDDAMYEEGYNYFGQEGYAEAFNQRDIRQSAFTYLENIADELGLNPSEMKDFLDQSVDVSNIKIEDGLDPDQTIAIMLLNEAKRSIEANEKYLISNFKLSDYVQNFLKVPENRKKLAFLIQEELTNKGYVNFGFDKDVNKQVCDLLDAKHISDLIGGSLTEEEVRTILNCFKSFVPTNEEEKISMFANPNPASELRAAIRRNSDGSLVISSESLGGLSVDALNLLISIGFMSENNKGMYALKFAQDMITDDVKFENNTFIKKEINPTVKQELYSSGAEVSNFINTYLAQFKNSKAYKSDGQKAQLLLVKNSFNNKLLKRNNKAIKLSNISSKFGEKDIMTATMLNFVKDYIPGLSHPGSLMTVNFDSAEAVGSMIVTLSILSKNLQEFEIKTTDDKGNVTSEKIGLDKATSMKLALDLYKKTSGIDQSATFAKYTVIVKDKNGEFKFTTLGYGNAHSDEHPYSLAIGSQMNKELLNNSSEVYVISAEKNALSATDISFADGLKIFKYDQETQNKIIEEAYWQAITEFNNNKERYQSSLPEDATDHDKAVVVLSSKVTDADVKAQYVRNATNTFISKAIEGMDENSRNIFIKSVEPVIMKLFTSTLGTGYHYQAGTSRNTQFEELAYNTMKEFGIEPESRTSASEYQMNKMIETTIDAITTFITYENLPYDVKVSLENVKFDLVQTKFNDYDEFNKKTGHANSFEKDVYIIFNTKDEQLKTASINAIKKFIDSDPELKRIRTNALIQYILLSNKRGAALQSVLVDTNEYLNHAYQESKETSFRLNDYDQYGNDNKTSNEFSVKSLFGSGRKLVSFDIENFYDKDNSSSSGSLVYEIGLVIVDGNDDFDYEYAKKSAKRINFYIRYTDFENEEAFDSKGNRTIKINGKTYESGSSKEEMDKYFKMSANSNDDIVITIKNNSKEEMAKAYAIISKYITSSEYGIDDKSLLIGHNSKLTDIAKLTYAFGEDNIFSKMQHLDTFIDMLKGQNITNTNINDTKGSLEALRLQFGRSTDKAHNALDDAEFTLELALYYAKNQLTIKSVVQGMPKILGDFFKNMYPELIDDNGLIKQETLRDALKHYTNNINDKRKGMSLSKAIENGSDKTANFIANYRKYAFNLDEQLFTELRNTWNAVRSLSTEKAVKAQIREIADEITLSNRELYETLQNGGSDRISYNIAAVLGVDKTANESTVKEAIGKLWILYNEYKNHISYNEKKYLTFVKFLMKDTDELEMLFDSLKVGVDVDLKKYKSEEKEEFDEFGVLKTTPSKEYRKTHDVNEVNNVINDLVYKKGADGMSVATSSFIDYKINNQVVRYEKAIEPLINEFKGILSPKVFSELCDLLDSYRTMDFNNPDNDVYTKRRSAINYLKNGTKEVDSRIVDQLLNFVDEYEKNEFDRSYTMNTAIDYNKELTLVDNPNVRVKPRSDTIYMTEEKFKSIFRMSLNEAREAYGQNDMYLTILRHPVARHGAYHTYRVEVVSDGIKGLGMLTDIFYSYHSGDYDGDKILIRTPDLFTMKHGETLVQMASKIWSFNDEIHRMINDKNLLKNANISNKAKGLMLVKTLSYDGEKGFKALDLLIKKLNETQSDEEAQSLIESIINDNSNDTNSNEYRKILNKYVVLKVNRLAEGNQVENKIRFYSPMSQDDMTDRVLRLMHFDAKTNIKYFSIKDSSTGYLTKEFMNKNPELDSIKSDHIGDFLAYSSYTVSDDTINMYSSIIASGKKNADEFINNYITTLKNNFKGDDDIVSLIDSFSKNIINYNESNDEEGLLRAMYLIDVVKIAETAYREKNIDIFDKMANETMRTNIDGSDTDSDTLLTNTERSRLNAMIKIIELTDPNYNGEFDKYTDPSYKVTYKNVLDAESKIWEKLCDKNLKFRRTSDSEISKTLAEGLASGAKGSLVERFAPGSDSEKNSIKQTIIFRAKGVPTDCCNLFRLGKNTRDLAVSGIHTVKTNSKSVDSDTIKQIVNFNTSGDKDDKKIYSSSGSLIIPETAKSAYVMVKTDNGVWYYDLNQINDSMTYNGTELMYIPAEKTKDKKEKYIYPKNIVGFVYFTKESPEGSKVAIHGTTTGKTTLSNIYDLKDVDISKVKNTDITYEQFVKKFNIDIEMSYESLGYLGGKLTKNAGIDYRNLKFYKFVPSSEKGKGRYQLIQQSNNQTYEQLISEADYIVAENVPVFLQEFPNGYNTDVKTSDTDMVSFAHIRNDPDGFYRINDSVFRIEDGQFSYDPSLTAQMRSMKKRYETGNSGSYSNGLFTYRLLMAFKQAQYAGWSKEQINKLIGGMMQQPAFVCSNKFNLLSIYDEMTDEQKKVFDNAKDPLLDKLKDFYIKTVNNETQEATYDEDIQSKTKLKEKPSFSTFYRAKANELSTRAHNYVDSIGDDRYEPTYDMAETYFTHEDLMRDVLSSYGNELPNSYEIDEMSLNGKLNLRNGRGGIMTPYGFNPQEYFSSCKFTGKNPGAGKEDPKIGASEALPSEKAVGAMFSSRSDARALADMYDENTDSRFSKNDSTYITHNSSKDNMMRSLNSKDKKSYEDTYSSRRQRDISEAMFASAKTKNILERAALFRGNNPDTNRIKGVFEGGELHVSKDGLKYISNPTPFNISYGDIDNINNINYGYARNELKQQIKESIASNSNNIPDDFLIKGNTYIECARATAKQDLVSLIKAMESMETIEIEHRSADLDIEEQKKLLQSDSDYVYDRMGNFVDTSVEAGTYEYNPLGLSTSGIKTNNMHGALLDRTIQSFSVNMKRTKQMVLGKEYRAILNTLKTDESKAMYSKYCYIRQEYSKLLWINKKIENYVMNKTGTKSVYVDGNMQYNLDDLNQARNAILQNLRNGREYSEQEVIEYTEKYLAQGQRVYSRVDKLVDAINERLLNLQIQYAKAVGEPMPDHLFLSCKPVATDAALRKIDALRNAESRGEYLITGKKHSYSMYQGYKSLSDDIYLHDQASFDFFHSINEIADDIGRMESFLNLSNSLKKQGAMSNSLIYDALIKILNDGFDKDNYEDIGSRSLDEEDPEYRRLTIMMHAASSRLKDSELNIIFGTDTTIIQRYCIFINELKRRFIDTYGQNADCSYSSIYSDYMKNSDNKDAGNALSAYNLMFDAVAEMDTLIRKYDRGNKTLVEQIVKTVKDLATSQGKVLVDRFGRDVQGDLADFRKISRYGYEDKIWILKHSGNQIFGTKDEALAMDVLSGDVYLMDANAQLALRDLYIRQDASLVKKILSKTNNIAIQAIMGNPAKLVSRLINFSMFDMASSLRVLGFHAFNASELDETRKELSAYLQTKGQVQSRDLEDFINITGVDAFDKLLIAEGEGATTNNPYHDMVGKLLTTQHIAVRFAAFKILKHRLESVNGDVNKVTTTLGNSFFLRHALNEIEEQRLSDGKLIKSKEGQQAAAIIANQFGTYNDMPKISSTASKYGMVFTTFPMALFRGGVNEFKSLGAAFKEVFTGQADTGTWKYLGASTVNFIIMTALTSLLNYAMMLTAGMDPKEAAESAFIDGETVDLPRSFFTNELVTSSSAQNPILAFKSSFIDPMLNHFTETNEGEETFADKFLSGLLDEFSTNVYSHMNPFLKAWTDSINGNPFNKYGNSGSSYMENVGRHYVGYLIGSSGSNALFNKLVSNSYDDDKSLASSIIGGLISAFSEEAGNSTGYKTNTKNYYNAINLINKYINAKNTDTEYKPTKYKMYDETSSSSLATKLKNAMKSKASAAAMYKIVQEAIQSGATSSEIQVALRKVSLMAKVSKLDISDMQSMFSDTELDSIKVALAYEKYMFPCLYEMYKKYSSSGTFENYDEDGDGYYFKSSGLYLYNKYRNYSYGNKYKYKTYNKSMYKYRNSYGNNTSGYNTYSNSSPFDSYSRAIANINNTYFNKYKNQASNPIEAFNNATDRFGTGISQDIWGTKTQNYTDGSSYVIKDKGNKLGE